MLTLESNTISEFHGSLMTYYELVKVKQKEHAGNWITFKDALKIPDIKFSKEFPEVKFVYKDLQSSEIGKHDLLKSEAFFRTIL